VRCLAQSWKRKKQHEIKMGACAFETRPWPKLEHLDQAAAQ